MNVRLRPFFPDAIDSLGSRGGRTLVLWRHTLATPSHRRPLYGAHSQGEQFRVIAWMARGVTLLRRQHLLVN